MLELFTEYLSNKFGIKAISSTFEAEQLVVNPTDTSIVDTVHHLYNVECTDQTTRKMIITYSKNSVMIIEATNAILMDIFGINA